MSGGRMAVKWAAGVLALAIVAGCSPLPTAPGGTAARMAVPAGLSAGTLTAADSVAVVPVTAALGGVVRVNGYTLVFAPGALDRDANVRLRVIAADQSLDVSFTPSSASVLVPPVLSADLGAVPLDQAGDYAIYQWVDPAWQPVAASLLSRGTLTVRAAVPGVGRYALKSWTDVDPNAPELTSAVEIAGSAGGSASCGTVRLDFPPDALRGDGVVSVHWKRASNMVDLNVTPAELNGFDYPVKLSMDAGSLPASMRDQAVIYWWNPAVAAWEEVEGSTVDPETGRVSAPLQHFSEYTVGLGSKAGWGQMPGGHQRTE